MNSINSVNGVYAIDSVNGRNIINGVNVVLVGRNGVYSDIPPLSLVRFL